MNAKRNNAADAAWLERELSAVEDVRRELARERRELASELDYISKAVILEFAARVTDFSSASRIQQPAIPKRPPAAISDRLYRLNRDSIRIANMINSPCRTAASPTAAEQALTRGLFALVEESVPRAAERLLTVFVHEYAELLRDRGEAGAAGWLAAKAELIREILAQRGRTN